MPPITVASRAYRILGKLARFRFTDTIPDDLDLVGNEKVIGQYENDAGGFVMVTDKGMHVKNDISCSHVYYDEMVGPESPISKSEVSGLHIKLKDGSMFWLPVSGEVPHKFYEAFAFIRFIDRVIKDQVTGNRFDGD